MVAAAPLLLYHLYVARYIGTGVPPRQKLPPNSFEAGASSSLPLAEPSLLDDMGGSAERAPWCSPVASLLAMSTPGLDSAGACASSEATGVGSSSRRDRDSDTGTLLHMPSYASAAPASITGTRHRAPYLHLLTRRALPPHRLGVRMSINLSELTRPIEVPPPPSAATEHDAGREARKAGLETPAAQHVVGHVTPSSGTSSARSGDSSISSRSSGQVCLPLTQPS